jgi:hypothetical protein
VIRGNPMLLASVICSSTNGFAAPASRCECHESVESHRREPTLQPTYGFPAPASHRNGGDWYLVVVSDRQVLRDATKNPFQSHG